MNAFYLAGCASLGESANLTTEDAHHAARVMRLKPGEEVFVTDENGARFRATLQSVSEERCTVSIEEKLASNEPDVRVTLYQGLPKADKLEWIVQKLTELGVCRIVPVRMERCVVKLDEKDGSRKSERLNKIAREAGKQCKRSLAPEVTPPMSFHQARAEMKRHDLILLPWEDARGYAMKQAHADHPKAEDIALVIGPEGGMSAAEVGALEEVGAKQITLGPRILRTETAAVVASALTMMLWGDLS